uniref:Uncharacterized protein n=1 Tax=Ciona savignyi TaxID=51511 RepID=H2ZAF2_CIOSA
MVFAMKSAVLGPIILFIFIALSNGQNSDDVLRNPEEENLNDDESKKDSGGSNRVVILGVTLSASVMVAVAGIFIGKYFHVEKLLCCCCKSKKLDEEKLETIPQSDASAAWYGSDPYKESNIFMTGNVNKGYSRNDKAQEEDDKENIEVKRTSVSKTHGVPLFYRHHQSTSLKPPTMTMNIEPVGFGATTTRVAADGSIVRSQLETDNNFSAATETYQTSHNSSTSYKAAASVQDDILF